MRHITAREIERYGESAIARIPLLLIGKGIKKNKLDARFFQQSDLFPMLNRAITTEENLSPNPIWVERFTKLYSSENQYGNILIFSERDHGKRGKPIRLNGNSLYWQVNKPRDSQSIENHIHLHRAIAQDLSKPKECPLIIKKFKDPSNLNGIKIHNKIYKSFLDSSSKQFNAEFYLKVPVDGEYTIRLLSDGDYCLSLNKEIIISKINQYIGKARDSKIYLNKGFYPIQIYFKKKKLPLSLQWIKPKKYRWEEIPISNIHAPQ